MSNINKIFEIFAKNNPEPTTELHFTSSFECLIAVMLSAQTTDKQVNKVTAKLFKLANTPADMLALGLDQIMTTVKHIGLYRNKAKNIIGISQQLIDKHNAQVPNDLVALQQLPGVGRKTALVVLSSVFGQCTIAVDTHVQRVSHRIGLVANCPTPLKTEMQLMQVIPEQFLFFAHHWLILHGRYICQARKPLCQQCNIKHLCRYYNTSNNHQ